MTILRGEETSPEDERTVSSASLCMSPSVTVTDVTDASAATTELTTTESTATELSRIESAPVCTSTPRVYSNGHAVHMSDKVNGNANVYVSESTSMDVLSGGESDAGDTLSRRNNNSISSCVSGLVGGGGGGGTGSGGSRARRSLTYCVAKELLMTERTYKRDLDLVTVSWSGRVSALAGGAGGASGAGGPSDADGLELGVLARAALALEPLALAQGALLARLERAAESHEPEFKRIAEILYDYLYNIHDAYMEYTAGVGECVGGVEFVRRGRGRGRLSSGARALSNFDAVAPHALTLLLLRPLHRTMHYHHLATELCVGGCARPELAELSRALAERAAEQLAHVENHAVLCQLQRDITGYDKLLVPGREFLRLGCVYKHSSKGLQQRMLFLFSDVALLCVRSGGSFRAHAAWPLHALQAHPHDGDGGRDGGTVNLVGEDINVTLSFSSQHEYAAWRDALSLAVKRARCDSAPADVDTDLDDDEYDTTDLESGDTGTGGAGGALWHVCWHRAVSLSREHLHVAMRSHLSGYLLRKFKTSHGWQKLWVVLSAAALHFHKRAQDDKPLAELPLLGYTVSAPLPGDGINKDFVFKLQFKNHVYFFRADSQYTFNRWTEVLSQAMGQNNSNNNNEH